MGKIIAFGASYSRQSINREFARYAASYFEQHEVELLDLNDYDLPIFTEDFEKERGQPAAAPKFVSKIEEADLLIISIAEHNGNFTAAFKNLFDWASRVKLKMFEGKKILLLSTSPGGRGAKSAFDLAMDRFPRHGGEIIAGFSLPSFYKTYSFNHGILEEDIKADFLKVMNTVKI
jgi:chromate reductase, NAD(P)H dehydrogenase (quinone)